MESSYQETVAKVDSLFIRRRMILGAGLIYLPESPRYFVKKGNVEKAAHALGRLRGQPEDS
jgi:hypothetical protein